MKYAEVFSIVRDALVKSQLHHDMVNTCEDSPYHREQNVWVHTEMTLSWYEENLTLLRTEQQKFLSKMALLFHDTGKPGCRELKNHPERGMVYRYPAHELRSARLFEDFVISNNFFKLMTPQEFRQIKWMIEHHLPYDLKTPDQLARLHVDAVSQASYLKRAFIDMVLSDAHGRISDDHSGKLEKAWDWAKSFEVAIAPTKIRSVDPDKNLILLVGASGSGKSTFTKQQDDLVFSLDALRIRFYVESFNGCFFTPEIDYSKAWEYCNEHDSAFQKYWKAIFTDKIKAGVPIIVDNTNTSRKARRYYIALAKDHGYIVSSIEFPNALSTLIARQSTRGDKNVAAGIVARQYFGLTTPMIGREVDAAFLADSSGTLHSLGQVADYYHFVK